MSSPLPAYRPADNPFASHRVESLTYRCRQVEVAELAGRIPELGGRAAIVGGEGCGKTTLLNELAAVLPGDSVDVCIPGGCRRPWPTARDQLPRPVQPSHVILVDGAEQLGRLGWHLLLRAARPARCLVATLHTPGRLPTLIECRTDRRLLRDLFSELTPSDPLAFGLDDLYRRHGGDLRLCFRELYDAFAGRPYEQPSTGAGEQLRAAAVQSVLSMTGSRVRHVVRWPWQSRKPGTTYR